MALKISTELRILPLLMAVFHLLILLIFAHLNHERRLTWTIFHLPLCILCTKKFSHQLNWMILLLVCDLGKKGNNSKTKSYLTQFSSDQAFQVEKMTIKTSTLLMKYKYYYCGQCFKLIIHDDMDINYCSCIGQLHLNFLMKQLFIN